MKPEARCPNKAASPYTGLRILNFGILSSFEFRHSSLCPACPVCGSSMTNRLPRLALDNHAAAVGVHDVLHQAQADANALRLPAQFRAKPVKPLENLLMLR